MKPPYILRMIEEKRELDIKIEALAGWINNHHHFQTLTRDEQEDQRVQLHHMRGYAIVLANRLRRAGESDATA